MTRIVSISDVGLYSLVMGSAPPIIILLIRPVHPIVGELALLAEHLLAEYEVWMGR